MIEPLELRRLLAGDVTLGVGGVNAISAFAGVGFALNPVALIGCTVNGSVDNTPGDFQVQIDWGDGTTDSNMKPVADGNEVLIKGTHTYTAPNTYPITVTVTGPGGSVASSVTTQADVIFLPDPASRPPAAPRTFSGPQPLAPETLGVGGVNAISAFAGVGFALDPVAVIGGTYNGSVDNAPADYKAQINWGDGPSWDANTRLADDGNEVLVKGTHIYQAQGTYDVTVYVTGPDGQTASSTTTQVDVTPLPDAASRPPDVPTSYNGPQPLAPETLGLGGVNAIAAQTGVTFAVSPVALIGGTYNGAGDNAPTDYKAQINWGDSPSWDTNTTLAASGNEVQVSGSHQYKAQGTYDVTLYVTGPDGQTVSSTTTQVDVTPAPVNASGLTFAATEGAAFSGNVATFNDADTLLEASDFTAQIDWGDGTTDTGTVSGAGGSDYTVTGKHTYADEHAGLPVSVTISGGGANGTAGSTANVADASLTASASTFSATAGSSFTTTVASFNDANTAAPTSDFTVSINWGDGTSSGGSVSSAGSGKFNVSGTHQYAQAGALPVTVAIKDAGGSTVQANSQADVSALVAPHAPVLAPQSDTGASDTDGITRDNGSPSAPLTFTVGGVSPANGYVQLYNVNNPSAPVALGSPSQATGGTATITLAENPLADGTYAIAATTAATLGGTQSALSPATPITIQTSLTITATNPANQSVVSALPNGQIAITFSHPLAGLTSGGPALSSADPYGIFLLARGPSGRFSAPGVSATAPGYYVGNLPLHATATYEVNPSASASIVLTPTVPLSSDVYLISITLSDFTDLAGNTLSDPSGDGYRSFLLQLPPANSQPLAVTGVTAYAGAVVVHDNAIPQPDTLSIAFNKPLYPGSAAGGNVQLIANPGPNYSVVPSVAAYNPSNDTIALTPAALLHPGTVYLIAVSGAVSDDQGYGHPGFPLGTTFYDSFTVTGAPTGAGQRPFQVATNASGNPAVLPNPNLIWNAPLGYVSVQFTEPLNLASLDRYSAMLVPENLPPNVAPLPPNIPLNSSLAFNPNTNQLIIVPTEPAGTNLIDVVALARMNATNGDPLQNNAGQAAGAGGNAPYYATFELQAGGSGVKAVITATHHAAPRAPRWIAQRASSRSRHPKP